MGLESGQLRRVGDQAWPTFSNDTEKGQGTISTPICLRSRICVSDRSLTKLIG